MAISEIKKIRILGHKTIRQVLIEDLQNMGLVEVMNLSDSSDEEGTAEQQVKVDKNTETIIFQLEFCLSFLDKYSPPEGALEKLKKGKPEVKFADLSQLAGSFDIGDCYGKANDIEKEFQAVVVEKNRLILLQERAGPWKGMNVLLSRLRDTSRVMIKPVRLPLEIHEEFLQEINIPLVSFEAVSTDADFVYGVLFAHCDAGDDVAKILTRFALEVIDLVSLEDSPPEIIRAVKNKLEQLQTKSGDLEKQASDLTRYKSDIKVLHDFYTNRKERVLLQNLFSESQQTFFLEGWIRARDVEYVKATLEKRISEIAIQIVEPGPEEEPPVDLANQNLVGAFEPVTSLYGLPNYRESDPTPILAPFFFVFFGLCLADLGYGLIMMAVTGYAIYNLKLEQGMKKMMGLLFYSGVATVLAGAATGGWFGDIFIYIGNPFLLRLRQAFIVFDPIKEPMVFMVLALVLGIVQIVTGIVVQLLADLKKKDYGDAVLKEGAWLMFFLGLIFFGMAKAEVFPFPEKLALLITYLGLVVLFVFAGRGEFNPLKRLGMGLLELYNIIGYFSDILSYSRILALGLASAVVANVVNQIAAMTLAVPYLGYIMMILILLGGHTFNLLINALGAYVHTSRLQYVEFFPKFFQGGGRLFSPFHRVMDYSIIKD